MGSNLIKAGSMEAFFTNRYVSGQLCTMLLNNGS